MDGDDDKDMSGFELFMDNTLTSFVHTVVRTIKSGTELSLDNKAAQVASAPKEDGINKESFQGTKQCHN